MWLNPKNILWFIWLKHYLQYYTWVMLAHFFVSHEGKKKKKRKRHLTKMQCFHTCCLIFIIFSFFFTVHVFFFSKIILLCIFLQSEWNYLAFTTLTCLIQQYVCCGGYIHMYYSDDYPEDDSNWVCKSSPRQVIEHCLWTLFCLG